MMREEYNSYCMLDFISKLYSNTAVLVLVAHSILYNYGPIPIPGNYRESTSSQQFIKLKKVKRHPFFLAEGSDLFSPSHKCQRSHKNTIDQRCPSLIEGFGIQVKHGKRTSQLYFVQVVTSYTLYNKSIYLK